MIAQTAMTLDHVTGGRFILGVGTGEALIANCCTHAHDPSRSSRLDPFANHIPYSWQVRSH